MHIHLVLGLGMNTCNVNYHECVDEAQLLTEFIKYWRKEKFDIVTGWNVDHLI